MSSASHDRFLLKLHQEMQRSSQTYRTSVSDKKRHIFTYQAKDIRAALKVLLSLEENVGKKRTDLTNAAGENSTFQKEYGKLVTKLTTDLRTAFKREAAAAPEGTIIVDDDIRGGLVAIVYEVENRSNFNLIKKTYEGHLDKFYKEFLKLLTGPLTRPTGKGKKKRTKELGEASDVFNLGHKEGGSNIEHMMNDAVHTALSEGFGNDTLTPQAKKAIRERLGVEDAATIFRIFQDSDNGIIEVSLEGAWGNYVKGGTEEQQLNRDLKKVLEKLDIEELEGSDSLVRGQRKKLVKALMEPYLKNKRVTKIKKENTKPTASSSKSFEHKPKISSGTGSRTMTAKAAVRSRQAPKQSTPNLASILGFLNMKLPDVVAGNMGDPRLNYRTGRFAQSVRATDISKTPKGFPSIGYTYDKARYGVFESTSGNSRASVDRDPRRLIDSSIREIVIQLGVGRIFTRRL